MDSQNTDNFSEKFYRAIEKHLSDPYLDIKTICRETGMSRTNLYRKLKEITALTPKEIIRMKRLEIAAKMLRESDSSVSEISAHVGFNSHAYFTQCFRAVYGCSPSEYAGRPL